MTPAFFSLSNVASMICHLVMIYALIFKYKVELELVNKPCLNNKVVHTEYISHCRLKLKLRGGNLWPIQLSQSHRLWTPSHTTQPKQSPIFHGRKGGREEGAEKGSSKIISGEKQGPKIRTSEDESSQYILPITRRVCSIWPILQIEAIITAS